MNRAFVKALAVIIEAGIEVLAEHIKKRSRGKRNGNLAGLDRDHSGGLAHDLGVQPSGSAHPNRPWRLVTRVHEHGRSKY